MPLAKPYYGFQPKDRSREQQQSDNRKKQFKKIDVSCTECSVQVQSKEKFARCIVQTLRGYNGGGTE